METLLNLIRRPIKKTYTVFSDVVGTLLIISVISFIGVLLGSVLWIIFAVSAISALIVYIKDTGKIQELFKRVKAFIVRR